MNDWLAPYKHLTLPPLSADGHDDPSDGLCAMEMVAFIERLPHSDRPECTCPVLAAYVRRLNDVMPSDERQRLKPLLPRLVGTLSIEHEIARAEYLAMQAVNVFAPIALRASGLGAHASACANAVTLAEGREAAADAAADAAAYAAAHAAAHAAADAAYAAAYAAADAAAADADSAWNEALAALEGAISIGPSSGWTSDIASQVSALAELA